MIRRFSRICVLTAAILIAAIGMRLAAAQNSGQALLLTVDSAIGPASADYILSGIKRAETNGNPLVILALDTPGGLDSAMRDIIKGILAAKVPVAMYVSPGGSRAASAGTYMLYASHVAAMHPVSNLGAATPVQIGGAPSMPEMPEQNPPADPADETGDESATDQPQPAAPHGIADVRLGEGRELDLARESCEVAHEHQPVRCAPPRARSAASSRTTRRPTASRCRPCCSRSWAASTSRRSRSSMGPAHRRKIRTTSSAALGSIDASTS